jgi:hypothetical protein
MLVSRGGAGPAREGNRRAGVAQNRRTLRPTRGRTRPPPGPELALSDAERDVEVATVAGTQAPAGRRSPASMALLCCALFGGLGPSGPAAAEFR